MNDREYYYTLIEIDLLSELDENKMVKIHELIISNIHDIIALSGFEFILEHTNVYRNVNQNKPYPALVLKTKDKAFLTQNPYLNFEIEDKINNWIKAETVEKLINKSQIKN